MINFHPETALLQAFAADTLPLNLALAVAAHVELCPNCAARVSQFEAELANTLLGMPAGFADIGRLDPAFEAMLQRIMDTPVDPASSELMLPPTPIVIRLDGRERILPRALRHLVPQGWQRSGKVARANVQSLLDDKLQASLIWLEPGARIPEHEHGGLELNLVLDGSLSDEHGRYGIGDFVLVDSRTIHSQRSEEGCLCYTVLDAPLHFTDAMTPSLRDLVGLLN